MRNLFIVALCLFSGAISAPRRSYDGPVPVRVVTAGGRATLLRAGSPFVVRGAGGDGSMELLRRMGGNSVRTWGADRLGQVLDEAHKHGLTVCAGIWLGHLEHGFRYDDPAQVARQKEDARQVILRYRRHPALLLWAFGNEMEGDGSHDAIWKAVNDIAAMARELDPYHPTMTVIAEVGGSKVRNLHRLCPAIDIVGINSYGGAPSVAERYVAAGGSKPFILTEFGPPGPWEVARTAWGAPVEPSSTEKAASYQRAWKATVGKSALCLGAYAFLWGNKQEATATWFGMLLPDGTRLEPVDAMCALWTGRPPRNRCPSIRSLKIPGPTVVAPGAEITAALDCTEPDGDPLTAEWVLQAEAVERGTGGASEPVPPVFRDALVRSGITGATLRAPARLGAYRLFVYVRDGRGGGATANIPLRVRDLSAETAARKAALPLIVYDEAAGSALPYAPSGWMGNTAGVQLDERCTENPASGKTCIRCSYQPADGWAGVVWQDPPNDWGDRAGGWDLRRAKVLSWKARGQHGGEKVTFLMGLLGSDKRYPDTAQRRLENVTLSDRWQTYSIRLDNLDLSCIKTGFGWIVSGQGRPVTFYLDDIRFE